LRLVFQFQPRLLLNAIPKFVCIPRPGGIQIFPRIEETTKLPQESRSLRVTLSPGMDSGLLLFGAFVEEVLSQEIPVDVVVHPLT
jgi:hypothetical protein